MGYQLVQLARIVPPRRALAGVRAAAPILDAFYPTRRSRKARALDDSDLGARPGSPQGTVMSLYGRVFRRNQPVAGIVGFSGRLLAPRTAGEMSCVFAFRRPLLVSWHRRPSRPLHRARRSGKPPLKGRRKSRWRRCEFCRHRPLRSTRKDYGAAGLSFLSDVLNRNDALDDTIAGEERLDYARASSRNPIPRPPSTPAEHSSRRDRSEKLVGRPRTSKAFPTAPSLDRYRF